MVHFASRCSNRNRYRVKYLPIKRPPNIGNQTFRVIYVCNVIYLQSFKSLNYSMADVVFVVDATSLMLFRRLMLSH